MSLFMLFKLVAKMHSNSLTVKNGAYYFQSFNFKVQFQ